MFNADEQKRRNVVKRKKLTRKAAPWKRVRREASAKGRAQLRVATLGELLKMEFPPRKDQQKDR
jgi:hypothetical protein